MGMAGKRSKCRDEESNDEAQPKTEKKKVENVVFDRLGGVGGRYRKKINVKNLFYSDVLYLKTIT